MIVWSIGYVEIHFMHNSLCNRTYLSTNWFQKIMDKVGAVLMVPRIIGPGVTDGVKIVDPDASAWNKIKTQSSWVSQSS